MEVLKNVPALGNLIRTGNWQQVYSTMETQSKEGMMTMEQHLLHLFQHNIITKDSAIAYTNEASLLSDLVDYQIVKIFNNNYEKIIGSFCFYLLLHCSR